MVICWCGISNLFGFASVINWQAFGSDFETYELYRSSKVIATMHIELGMQLSCQYSLLFDMEEDYIFFIWIILF